jgi:hypothetical protein
VDHTKIAVILDLQPPTSVIHLRGTLGHTGYYKNFIKGYAQITTPMEKLLKKEAKFRNEDFQGFGYIEVEISDHIDFDLPRLEEGVPCSCGCVIHSFGHSTISTRGRRHRQPN